MKKIGLLNQPLSTAISGMGHTDTLVICDAGLPIPFRPRRIDLALVPGIPSFLDTLEAVLSEMEVERAIVAAEMAEASPDLLADLRDLLGEIPIEMISHKDFKGQTNGAQAVVRTGECTPYANIILVSGVVF